MDNRHQLIAALFLILLPCSSFAQSDSYQFEFLPDVWYNQTDGIRLGLRVSGNMEGTYLDGPHRLNGGVWLGSKIPEQPVSYYLSFTEPIPSISDFGEEFNIQLTSSIRTGYSQHGAALNKRFQKGFDELRFQKVSLSIHQEKAIDNTYRLIPFQETNWKTLAGFDLSTHGYSPWGTLKTHLSLRQNVNGTSENFSFGTIEVKHITELGKGFGLNLRTFGALVSEDAPQEYKYSLANRNPASWLNKGLTRAEGTIPTVLFEDGLVQVAGGFNLRGYFLETVAGTSDPNTDHTLSYRGTIDQGLSLNTELIFPNYLDGLLNRSILGDFIQLRTYVFQDIAKVSGITFENNIPQDLNKIYADAGLGIQFSVNIPDWLGNDRGFALRYEVPLWLSDPNAGEKSFKFRNLLGIGAIISF